MTIENYFRNGVVSENTTKTGRLQLMPVNEAGKYENIFIGC